MSENTENPTTTPKYGAQAKWRERNPIKRWAHVAVASAIRRGILDRKPCEVCGREDGVDFHHPDHRRPLDGHFLCRRHHKEADKRLKAEGGGG